MRCFRSIFLLLASLILVMVAGDQSVDASIKQVHQFPNNYRGTWVAIDPGKNTNVALQVGKYNIKTGKFYVTQNKYKWTSKYKCRYIYHGNLNHTTYYAGYLSKKSIVYLAGMSKLKILNQSVYGASIYSTNKQSNYYPMDAFYKGIGFDMGHYMTSQMNQ